MIVIATLVPIGCIILIGTIIYVILEVKKSYANAKDGSKIDFNEEVVLVRYKKPYYNK